MSERETSTAVKEETSKIDSSNARPRVIKTEITTVNNQTIIETFFPILTDCAHPPKNRATRNDITTMLFTKPICVIDLFRATKQFLFRKRLRALKAASVWVQRISRFAL